MSGEQVCAELERIDPFWAEYYQFHCERKSKKGDPEYNRFAEVNKQILEAVAKFHEALGEIAEIIETVDNRCMAADGPVDQTLREMTPREIRRIYNLARTHHKGEK